MSTPRRSTTGCVGIIVAFYAIVAFIALLTARQQGLWIAAVTCIVLALGPTWFLIDTKPWRNPPAGVGEPPALDPAATPAAPGPHIPPPARPRPAGPRDDGIPDWVQPPPENSTLPAQDDLR